MVTLIELKKAKMMALKNHDSNATTVLGLVISAYQKAEIEKGAKGETMSDADMVSVLNMILKELADEKAMYEGAGRDELAKADEAQMEIVKAYLPKMMSDDEIREVISKLEDKSIKSIMVVFKTEYAGKVNMSDVSRIAKEFK